MAFPTWTPPRPPQLGNRLTIDQKIKEAKFGDGYEQNAADGLNSIRRQWSLSWSACTDAEADQIENFWIEQGKTKAFWYQVPGTAAAFKWKFATYDRTQGNPDSIQVTIRQVFDRES